ncbi:hypothetical protein QW060_18090 [Myroides ceti]|uniref:Uncharacterized protein n=1 Tax=Paenimyroides ceti TaxID=395087 RepID=A0ABT8CWR8_9FLAO|nr:hypothetical protein [Paenimyroides ceti]MDN3708988.1 hypothetical protein [Paenimyroides ceti]
MYGDWTNLHMYSWKEIVNPIFHQPYSEIFLYFRQKFNDSSLIIDAMDILHGKSVDGFCIVSQ